MRRLRAPAPARSEQEIKTYVSAVQACPACEHEGLSMSRFVRSTVRGEAAIVDATCALCYVPTQITFDAGPGWEAQPPAGDPRMATGDAPSALIPESVFRTDLEFAWKQVEIADELGEDARRENAASCIQDLIEIRKLNGGLTAGEEQQLRHCSALFAANGGKLPSELAAPQSDVIECGEVASRKEAYFHAVQTSWRGCPRCGARYPRLTAPLPHEYQGTGYEAQLACDQCGAKLVLRYRPGTGWDKQPGEDDLRITAAKSPSTHLEPDFLLAFAEQQAENLRGGGALFARSALEALDELEKFSDFVIPDRAAYAKLKKHFRSALG